MAIGIGATLSAGAIAAIARVLKTWIEKRANTDITVTCKNGHKAVIKNVDAKTGEEMLKAILKACGE